MSAELKVGGDPARPTFTFRRSGFNLQPQLGFPGSLSVSRVRDDGHEEIAWYVNENRSCPPRGIESVRYGEPPPGAEFVRGATADVREATPLVPGAIYAVGLSGCGYTGGIFFAVVDGKFVFEQGSGDLPLKRLREKLGG